MSEFSWLLEERTDAELQQMKMKKLVEKSEHESELKVINDILKDIGKEMELRDLAGGHKELQEFREKMKNRKKAKDAPTG